MPARFYLRDAAYAGGGTMPSGEQGAGTPSANCTWTGATTIRQLNDVIGTLQVAPTLTSPASTTQQRHLIRMFASRALAAQTIGAQTWRLNVADAESSTSANFWVNLVNLYVWRPSTGAKVGTIIDGSNGASQGGLEPTAAAAEQTTTFTFSGSAVTCQAGDVLVLEVWAVATQGAAMAYTLTFYYDGTVAPSTTENTATSDCASYLEATTSLTYGSTTYNDSVTEAASAADVLAPGQIMPQTVTEVSSASDALSTTATWPNSLAEAASAADTLSTTAVLGVAYTEAATAADALATTSTMVAAIAEASAATDAIVGGLLLQNALAEAASAADALAAGQVMQNAVTEAATAADALATVMTMASLLAEAASAADALLAGQIMSQAVSEAASAADALSSVATLLVAVSEAASAADALADQLFHGTVYNEMLVEAVSAADALATALQAVETLTESVNATDVVIIGRPPPPHGIYRDTWTLPFPHPLRRKAPGGGWS